MKSTVIFLNFVFDLFVIFDFESDKFIGCIFGSIGGNLISDIMI